WTPIMDKSDTQTVRWLLQPPERFKPWIGLLDHSGGVRILKDYSQKPWYVRKTVGAYALHRESRIYLKLNGIKGIPFFFGFHGSCGIVLEYIAGTVLNKFKGKDLPKVFFDRLELLLQQMHQRGVVHGDLRFKNILVTQDMEPYLIDFATAVSFSDKTIGPWRWFCRYMEKVDRRVLAKLKAKLAPHWLTETDQNLLSEKMFLLNSGRYLRRALSKWYKGEGRKDRKKTS
ncbi:MAG TPA: RIO1 family regulatory kinase/ATPase, partial [bacterium]|nr:RIO1 family regulatory kinase/ATPase [bacterium]